MGRRWVVALTCVWFVAELVKTPNNIVDRDWSHLATSFSAAVLLLSWLTMEAQ